MLRFLLNDITVTENSVATDLTVLDYLRDQVGLRGTKEGCASGDCGACTAVVGYIADGRLQYKSINTCITLLGSLHGQQLITVEHLQDGDALHPVQAAMVECHGSQCGFCTPGFVMSLFAMTKNSADITSGFKPHIERNLGGNLCRCTGYRPIIDAATQVLHQSGTAPDKFDRRVNDTIKKLEAINAISENNGFFRPRSIDELCELRARCPDAPIVAGATDFSLEMTQRLRTFEQIICIQHLADLNYLTEDEGNFYIGPCCTIANLAEGLKHLGSDIVNMLHRYGATQVRNQATVGGSIANASPIGDLAPVFISMDATIVLQSVDGQRSMPLEDFFVDYRRTRLAPNEFVREIILPRTRATKADGECSSELKVYKISKRIDDDISTVCAAFYLQRNGDRIEQLRTGFGGMAAIPKRAHTLEKLVRGRLVDDELIASVRDAIANDFQPISDARASAAYRLQVAENLFRRLCIETGSEAVISRVGEHV